MAGNPQVVDAYGRAGALETSEMFGVMPTDGRASRVNYRHLSGQGVEASQYIGLARAALGTLEQFGPGDEGHGQAVIFGQRIDPLDDAGGRCLIR